MIGLFLASLALQPEPSIWSLEESVDPITDRRDRLAVLSNGRERVAVGCTTGSGGVAGVVFRFDSFIQSFGETSASVRFDSERPIETLVIFQGEQVQISAARHANQFVRGMASKRRVVFQVIDRNSRTHNAVFDIPTDTAPMLRALGSCSGFVDIWE